MDSGWPLDRPYPAGWDDVVRNPAHSFAGAGTYQVSLTATDDLGATDLVTNDLTVPGGIGGRGDLGECITGALGSCDVELLTSARREMFTLTEVTHATLAYDPEANTDPDGDSDGTSIIIDEPL